ncbi:MAG: hypothetical protein A2103_00865 [Gammaproteobacteria bacterium GWF2_41_13]|nr:MAG: hypothetical protein A2103_00865 [Gammaproteobacteria bacterium GWF2_41_13]
MRKKTACRHSKQKPSPSLRGASATKQSSFFLDCFVADAPRNDGALAELFQLRLAMTVLARAFMFWMIFRQKMAKIGTFLKCTEWLFRNSIELVILK